MNHLLQWNRLSQDTTKVRTGQMQTPVKIIFTDKENSQSFEIKTKNRKNNFSLNKSLKS